MNETQQLTCFKAYDIRGKLGTELNDDVAYRIGRAYGDFLNLSSEKNKKKVVVGGDVRLTSESLKLAVTNGLLDAGIDVVDIGLTGTEEIYFAAFHLKMDGGIEITASHNPIDYNGMKIVGHCAKPINGDTELIKIKNIAEQNVFSPIQADNKGTYSKYSIQDEYIDHILNYINLGKLKPLKLVINSGNGAAGHIIDAIEERFKINQVPVEIIKVNHEPDGNFPNGIPNPLLPENRADTIEAVIKHKADMGIAFDGDFDRCFLFDEKGNFIEGYYIVGLLAESFLSKEKSAKIIHDPRLTWNTIDIVENNGGIPVVTKTGHVYIKERMRQEDAIYGGEMSAHHYFRDFAYCDSGMIPWLLVTELLSIKDKKLSELVEARIAAYPVSGEINRVIENPKQAIENIYRHFETDAVNIDNTDGLSMEFSDWRFNLRVSNTEPLVRLNVETKRSVILLENKTAVILSLLDDK